MKVLHLDENHPLLLKRLDELGIENDFGYTLTKNKTQKILHKYNGIVVRSRFPIDKDFLSYGKKLQFVARLGAGMENIDVDFCTEMGIHLINAPEGNRTAVAEHTLGMLLSLMNNLRIADIQIRKGIWEREKNRGTTLRGKTIGIIGYGMMGKEFAKTIQSLGVHTLCVDILPDKGDAYAQQVHMSELQDRADIISLHLPENESTKHIVCSKFIDKFRKPFYIINTARGICINTQDLLKGIQEGKILGAGLDVLEYEKKSFTALFDTELPNTYETLLKNNNILLSPHVAGWTHESYALLAKVVADKISKQFF